MIFVWLLKSLWIFVMNLCFKKKKMSLHCDGAYFVIIISLLFSNFSVLRNVGTRSKG